MKSKLMLICTIMTVALTAAGCSSEKVFKDKETGYQMNYDSTVWTVEKNKEVAEDYGTFTYSAVFNSKASTESGEPAAELKVLKEDLSEFTIESEETKLEDVASSLAGRLDDGFVSYQNATIAGLKGYWITVAPLDGSEGDVKNDIIFFIADDAVYEFYYTAVGEDNYSSYEADINYMLYYFSEI